MIIHTDIDGRFENGHWDYETVGRSDLCEYPSVEDASAMNKFANFFYPASQDEAEAQVAKLLG
jgi:uncharacterized membrane protein